MGSADVRLPDGRVLEYWLEGPEEGDLLVFHNGTPSNGELYMPVVADAAERGLRTLSYSRPGYGTSTRQEAHTVADCAADVAALADHLGVDRFLVAGESGGGPHSLACAALLPDRVFAALVIAGAAPWGATGDDWRDGMGAENVEAMEAHLAGPEACRAHTERQAEDLYEITAQQLLEVLGDLVSDVDRPHLTGGFAEYLASTTRAAFTQGWEGWWDDGEALIGDWGFDVSSIRVPVALWHGEDDRFVPIAEGRWVADHVPGVSAHLLAGEGHLSIAIGHFPEMLDELIALGGPRT